MNENPHVFDLVVVGSGSAAGTVASRCRAAGWSVAMVEKQAVGGTCALRGCDPKKVLVGAAAALDGLRNLATRGVDPAGAALRWPELMAFKRSFTDPYPAGREAAFDREGVELFHGVARFMGPSTIGVADDRLEARRAILIATGARPRPLGIPGSDLVTTSEGFLELENLPSRVVFIGGGFVSFEFAHVAARAGANVTILHRSAKPLGGFDPDLVDRLVARTRELGVDVQLEAPVTSVERTTDGLRVHGETGGAARAIDADLVVHGAGRVPDLADLDCATGGVDCGPGGVAVTPHLQSVSNPLVYAAGDCADSGGPRLTPVAGYDGRVVAANLLDSAAATLDYGVIPSVAFTLPPLATVGLSEAAASAAGRNVRVTQGDMADWYSSRRLGERCAAFKVLTDADTGLILGAHLLGPHADETINLFAMAMRQGMPAAELKTSIWAYPTHASDVGYMV
jgi:glutathione reductase (NADPH)